jgi:hypothetical protein
MTNAISAKLFRVLFLTAIIVMFSIFLFHFEGDNSPKIPAMEILMLFSETKNSIERCWNHKRSLQCDELVYPRSLSEEVDLLSLQNGTLVGINYKKHVVVILTPCLNGEKELHWECSGSPAKSLPQACKPIKNNREPP